MSYDPAATKILENTRLTERNTVRWVNRFGHFAQNGDAKSNERRLHNLAQNADLSERDAILGLMELMLAQLETESRAMTEREQAGWDWMTQHETEVRDATQDTLPTDEFIESLWPALTPDQKKSIWTTLPDAQKEALK